MSVAVGQARLKDAHRQLMAKWQRVREVWDDAAARRFEAEFLEALPTKVAAVMGAMSRAGEVVNQTRRECQ